MAKFSPGPTIGAISGSIGGTTYSKNRYGLYIRNRSIPTNPGTEYQTIQRGIVASISQAWRNLDDDERMAWKTWAQNNPVMDALGNSQVLTGHAAYVKINTRLSASGDSLLDLPPSATQLQQVLTLSMTADIGAGDFKVDWTPTPAGSTYRCVFFGALVTSPGVNYIGNAWKKLKISSKNQTTGVVLKNEFEERFGSLQVGQKAFVKLVFLETTSGLYSGPMATAQTISST